MTKSPMLWGAGLACALGGAVAGNALGSTPVLDRSTIGSFYQSHGTVEGLAPPREAPPDHYPLVTRAGTIPVGELSMRGLYSQRRYRALAYYTGYLPAEATIEEYPSDWDQRYAAFDEIHQSREPSAGADLRHETADAAAHSAEPPLQLAAGPATVNPEGNAKLIDVKATLAMR
jgi:hypothetical protein